MRLFRFVLVSIAIVIFWFGWVSHASAANTTLVPCHESPMFQQRQANAPDTYYYREPFKAYSSELLCGPDGLPHLPLDRLDRAVDVVIPFALFFYVAGFIGWSGRAYLRTSSQSATPEEMEIFIDLPLAARSIAQGLMWPLLALKEFLSGELTAREDEIPVSPR